MVRPMRTIPPASIDAIRRRTALLLALAGVASLAPARAAEPPAASAAPALPEPDRSRRVLRLVTWNILGGRGTDGSHPHAGLAAAIRRLNPDAIALQEVDVKTKRARGIDLPARLAELTGMQARFAEAMPHQGGSYGEAILTKLTIAREQRLALAAPAGHEPRAALVLDLAAPFLQKPFRFAGIHLDHLSDTVRAAQVRDLMARLDDASTTAPVILAGDFNASHRDASLAPLLASSLAPKPDNAATWPAEKPSEAIDHFFLRPSTAWQVVSIRRGDTVFPEPSWKTTLAALSDHFPVVIEVAPAP